MACDTGKEILGDASFGRDRDGVFDYQTKETLLVLHRSPASGPHWCNLQVDIRYTHTRGYNLVKSWK